MEWFITPETVTLPLADGRTLTVKKRLSAGDQFDAFERMYWRLADGTYAARADGSLIVSPAAMRLSTVISYLVDWTLTGPDGRPVAIAGVSPSDLTAILRNLEAARFAEIYAAIDGHDRAMARERAAQKKMPDGAPVLSTIS